MSAANPELQTDSAALLASSNTREVLAGAMRRLLHVFGMSTHADVDAMLANAKRARSMAKAVYSPEYKRMLAGIADDYERLARLRLVILNTERRLVDSRRLVDGH